MASAFSRRVLLLLLFLLSLLSGGAAARSWAAKDETGGVKCVVQRIINFGDSISDTGNLFRPGGAFGKVVGQVPYGESSPDGPTGRCSDGLLVIDRIAEALGVPKLPPYLGDSANFDRGVNFAVAGATALSQTCLGELGVILPYTMSSLEVQVGWFNQYLSGLCLSKQDCSAQFKKTLFLVGEIGGNDYNFALTQNKPLDHVKKLVPIVVDMIMKATQTVIDNGAVNIVVPGNFPIGCLPSYLALFGNASKLDKSGCASDLNDFAQFHNDYLQDSLNILRKLNPNVSIAYADYYSPFLEMISHASLYGLEKGSVLRACCGTGGGPYNFDMNQMCGPGVPVCDDPTKFMSWDGIHLTQAAYAVIANNLFSQIDFLNNWKCVES